MAEKTTEEGSLVHYHHTKHQSPNRDLQNEKMWYLLKGSPTSEDSIFLDATHHHLHPYFLSALGLFFLFSLLMISSDFSFPKESIFQQSPTIRISIQLRVLGLTQPIGWAMEVLFSILFSFFSPFIPFELLIVSSRICLYKTLTHLI